MRGLYQAGRVSGSEKGLARLCGPGDREHFFKLLNTVLAAAAFLSIKALLVEAQRYQNEKSFLSLAESPFCIRANPYAWEVVR